MTDEKDPEPKSEINPSAGHWSRVREWWGAHSVKWRRAISLAGIAALLAVLLQMATLVEKLITLGAPHLNSHTDVVMMNASEDTIFVQVSNTGGKPSTLVDYRLNFGTLPIENRTLRLVDEDRSKAIIPAGGHVPIRLTVLGLRTRARDDGQPGRFTRAEIGQLIKDQYVTIEIKVRESNDPPPRHWWNLMKPPKFHTAMDQFPAESIREFVMYWLPKHDAL